LINLRRYVIKIFKVFYEFFKEMLKMPKPWLAWIFFLMVVNMAAPIYFITSIEAKVALLAIMAGATTQALIYDKKGWVRLLGIGHFHWIPMLIWFYLRLDMASDRSIFKQWLLSIIILNGISLIIDITDVARYLAGERTSR
jgi:hypothetical protein